MPRNSPVLFAKSLFSCLFLHSWIISRVTQIYNTTSSILSHPPQHWVFLFTSFFAFVNLTVKQSRVFYYNVHNFHIHDTVHFPTYLFISDSSLLSYNTLISMSYFCSLTDPPLLIASYLYFIGTVFSEIFMRDY